jgi:hypothetical protein
MGYFISIALQYSTRKVQETKQGLELNGTHHLLVYADDVTTGQNIKTRAIQKLSAISFPPAARASYTGNRWQH